MKQTKPLTAKSAALFLGGLCSLLYFTSYFSRYALNVCIAEITGQGLITSEEAGIAFTMLFICYGAGQVASGILGDKFKTEILLLIGIVGAFLSNLLLPFLITYPVAIAILWGFNGLCQALFWPPIVKTIAICLPHRFYNGTCLAVSVAAHIGNISLYLLAPLCISVFGSWKILFYIVMGICVVSALVWIVGFRYFSTHFVPNPEEMVQPTKASDEHCKRHLARAFVVSGGIILLIGIILQGALKEGVTTWLPSYIRDNFASTPSDAILKSVSIPIASIICLLAVGYLYRRFLHNEALGAAFLFGIGTVMAMLILFIPSLPPMVMICFAAIMTGCMHGVNLFLIGYLPARFAVYGKVSTVSGVTNACAYVGCAVYTYLSAWLSTNFGWSATAISWLVISAIGLVACLVALPLWKRFTSKRLPDKEEEKTPAGVDK